MDIIRLGCVVLDVVVLVVMSLRLFHFTPIVIKLCIQIEHNILHKRTVADFQVRS